MILLDQFFSSKAKVQLLRTLCFQDQPFSLRQLASISHIPVFSVQRALKQLFEEELLHKKKVKNKLLYSLNPNHELADLLMRVFELENKERLKKRSLQYTQRAKQALQFASTARNFFNKTKFRKKS